MVFADTVYFVALTVRRDGLYPIAQRASTLLGSRKVVTLDAVLVEYLAHVSALGADLRRSAVDTVRELLVDPQLIVVRQDAALFDRALELYASRPDKQYSPTDCMGMLMCRDHNITDVLTHDRHYAQEGFTVLL